MSNPNQRKVAQPAGYFQVEKFDPTQYVTISRPASAQYMQPKQPCCEEKIIVQPQRQTLLLPSASLASEKSKQILLQQVQMQPQIVVQQQRQQQQQQSQQVQQPQAPAAKSRNRKKKGKKMKKILQAQQDVVTGRDILVAIEVTDESGSDASTTSILEENHREEFTDLFINNQLPRQEIVMSQMSFEGFTPNKPAPFSIESLNLPPPNANCYQEPPAPKGETKYVMIKEAPVFKTINQNFFSTNTTVKENVIHYNHVKDVIITLNRNHWHTQRIVVKDTNYHHYLINNVIKIKDIHHQKIETTNGESRNISDYKQVNRIEQPVCQQTVDEIVKAANFEINKTEVMQQQQQQQAQSYVQQENANVEYHYSPLQPCGGCPESMQQIQWTLKQPTDFMTKNDTIKAFAIRRRTKERHTHTHLSYLYYI